MRKRRYTFLKFALTFLFTVQFMTVAIVGLPVAQIELDSYGSIICSAHKNKTDNTYGNRQLPNCCINGCIFSFVLDRPVPENPFPNVAMGKGKALTLVLALSLQSHRSSFVYEARSPPVDMIFV